MKVNLEYFKNFDLKKFDNPDFKEDSVREEIICQLLELLGYSNNGTSCQIIRSKTLKHPWLTIGSGNRSVMLIPDYLLRTNSKNVLVLDAKSPSEDILNKKNIGQVYSYAIHPEINSMLFSLCNGREFALFQVNRVSPLLYFPINQIARFWDKLYRILCPEISARPEIVDYCPDFGIFQKRLGAGQLTKFIFCEVHTKSISKIDNDTYTCFTTYQPYADNPHFALSIDFNKKYLPLVLNNCKADYRKRIIMHLENSPFNFYGDPEEDDIVFSVTTKLSPNVITNKEEAFIPFIIEKCNNSYESISCGSR